MDGSVTIWVQRHWNSLLWDLQNQQQMRFTIGIDRGMDFVIVTREDLMILELYAMVRCWQTHKTNKKQSILLKNGLARIRINLEGAKWCFTLWLDWLFPIYCICHLDSKQEHHRFKLKPKSRERGIYYKDISVRKDSISQVQFSQ